MGGTDGTESALLGFDEPRLSNETELSLTDVFDTLDHDDAYAYMHHYFRERAPRFLKEHRRYFRKEARGFGEDAFHAMWWLLWREFQPTQVLEIGVYRGQVISLWTLLSKMLHMPSAVHGISPLTSLGDSGSSYDDSIDYEADILRSFRTLDLDPPLLIRSVSTDPAAVSHIRKHEWDLIYIDGGHDFEVVLEDYTNAHAALKVDGLLVLDDAAWAIEFDPPSYAFRGHPGPSRVAAEYAMKEMNFLGAVGHNLVFRRT